MKYYLSVPCVGCPWVSKGLKGQACLTVHCFYFLLVYIIMPSLASICLLLISEDKGGPTYGH